MSKIQDLVNIASSSGVSISGNWTYIDIPNTSFTLPKGEWLISVYVYMAFSSNNNVWLDLINIAGVESNIFSINPSRTASNTTANISLTPLIKLSGDTSYKMQISSSNAQSYTPYSILIKAVKLS